MKLSISAGTESVRLPQIVFRGSLDSVCSQAARTGFSAIDLFMGSPDEIPLQEMRSCLKRHKTRIVLLSAMGVLNEQGITFTHPDGSIRRKFLEAARGHLALAAELQAYVPIGFSRGRRFADEKPGDYAKRLTEGLADYDALAASFGAELVLEPINRYEINSINTVGEAVQILHLGEFRSTGLLLDLFHMNIEDRSLSAEIASSFPYVKHIHFTDSNRYSPGMGHTDMSELFRLLMRLGYTGFFGVEALPFPDPESAARLSFEFMQMLYHQYGAGDPGRLN